MEPKGVHRKTGLPSKKKAQSRGRHGDLKSYNPEDCFKGGQKNREDLIERRNSNPHGLSKTAVVRRTPSNERKIDALSRDRPIRGLN